MAEPQAGMAAMRRLQRSRPAAFDLDQWAHGMV